MESLFPGGLNLGRIFEGGTTLEAREHGTTRILEVSAWF